MKSVAHVSGGAWLRRRVAVYGRSSFRRSSSSSLANRHHPPRLGDDSPATVLQVIQSGDARMNEVRALATHASMRLAWTNFIVSTVGILVMLPSLVLFLKSGNDPKWVPPMATGEITPAARCNRPNVRRRPASRRHIYSGHSRGAPSVRTDLGSRAPARRWPNRPLVCNRSALSGLRGDLSRSRQLFGYPTVCDSST